MKSKLMMIAFITILLISLTGCGNKNTKILSCTVTSSEEERTTTSDLKVKIRNHEVKDMSLTLSIKLPKSQQSYKQAMISQLRQKANKVTSTEDGIKAVFNMGNSYFHTLNISKDVSYNELKQVLELQGYKCE